MAKKFALVLLVSLILVLNVVNNIGVTNRLLNSFNNHEGITNDLYINHWNVEVVSLEMYHDNIYGKAQDTYDIEQLLKFNFTVGYSVIHNPCFTLLATGDKEFVINAINFESKLIEHGYNNSSVIVTNDNIIYGDDISFREFVADEEHEYFGVYIRCDNFAISYVLPTVSLDINYVTKSTYWFIPIVVIFLIVWIFLNMTSYDDYRKIHKNNSQ